MSLTEAENVFAGIHEDGLNDVLTAIFSTRPHYLHYGSPPFVAASSVTQTLMSTIPFPGIPGGIPWALDFEAPKIDLHPETSGGMPPPLSLGTGRFSLSTKVAISLLCGDRRKDQTSDRPNWSGTTLQAALGVWAVGRVQVTSFGGGAGEIRFVVEAVELVDVTPDRLETLLECLIRMLLDAALQQVRIPFESLRAGAFSLTLLRGPEVEDDQVKLYGTT